MNGRTVEIVRSDLFIDANKVIIRFQGGYRKSHDLSAYVEHKPLASFLIIQHKRIWLVKLKEKKQASSKRIDARATKEINLFALNPYPCHSHSHNRNYYLKFENQIGHKIICNLFNETQTFCSYFFFFVLIFFLIHIMKSTNESIKCIELYRQKWKWNARISPYK